MRITLRKNLLLWLWLLLFSAAPTWTLAGTVDHVVARHRVLTTESSFDGRALAAAPVVPMSQVLSAGYGAEPVWVRLRIDPGLTPGLMNERLLLRVRPGYLDEILLFDPASASQPTGVTGDRHPLGWQAVPSAVFNVALDASRQPRDVWVRVTTKTARTAHFEVVRESDLHKLDAQAMLWSGLYLGCLVIFAIWGAAQLLVRRDALTLSFVGFQLASAAYGACILGYVRLLVDLDDVAALVDVVTAVMVLVAVFMSLLFNTVLLKEMHAPRNGLRIMVGILALFPVLLLMLLGGLGMQALQVNMVIVLLAPMVAWVIALKSQRGISGVSRAQAPGERWLAVGYFSVSMVLTSLAALPGLGVIEGPLISLHVIMLHGLVAGFLMLAMLLYRIYRLLQQRELLAVEAAFNRQRAQRERAHREDQQKLLSMLAHELKTPLATLRMLMGSIGLPARGHRAAERAVQDMNQVIERCLQAGQLDDDALRPLRQPVQVDALIREVVSSLPEGGQVRVSGEGSTPPVVSTDPQLLAVVIRNLLDNALKYGPSDAPVEVFWQASAGDEGPAMHVDVRNEVGLSGKPVADKVFTKYYRHPQAQRRTGSGLGLYLVQGLVSNLGGRVSYRDEGKHVKFRVTLPMVGSGAGS